MNRFDQLRALNDGLKDEDKPMPKRKNWMRNKLCTCNSGKKFKNCCWSKVKTHGTR